MKKFFSLSSIKESIKFRDRKNSEHRSTLSIERASIAGKRYSNLSTNSLSSRQSNLNIEVIRDGYNVDLSRVDGTFSKLHRACLLNYDEKKLFKYIKKQPATINQIDNVSHASPMHLCVVNGNIHYLSILIDHGGDVNLADGQGKTLLIKAIECTNEQIIQFLINRQAEVNKPDTKHRNTPLHWACLTANTNGYFKVISILLNCTHVNVNLANSKEETILHLIAKSSKNLYVFINDCLDNNGINLDKQDVKGRTPLFIACLYGNYRCVELLLNSNANPNVNNLIGESALQIARSKGFVDIVDLFEHNTTNQYLREMHRQPVATNGQAGNSVQNNLASASTTNVKRNSVFSYSSDVDFMKVDEDSWPETVSNTSVDKKQPLPAKHQAYLSTKTDTDQNSYNSFKMNTNLPLDSISSSSTLSNDLKQQNEPSASKDSNKLSTINQSPAIEEQTLAKPVLHPENDEFIKQMKFLIDEEIQMNEELDEMLFTKQPELEQQNKKDARPLANQTITNIYLSESDEDWADENDTLIKKPNINPINQPEQPVDKSNNSLRKQSLIYGLSEDESTEKKINNVKSKGKSMNREIVHLLIIHFYNQKTDKSSDESSRVNQIHKVETLEKIYRQSDQIKQPVGQQQQQSKLDSVQNDRLYISDSSLSSAKSLREDELVNKFDTLMVKIDEFEQANQKLSIELNDALERENELKLLNSELNHQFEEQNQQLISLESRLKQSEANYSLIKAESERFKEDFKIEREKFEREFVKFIQDEHKQTEQHLMRLLDDKQEMCNKLTDELNYLKDRYVNREQVPFANDDLIRKLEGNQLFNDLIKQNDKLNQNFQQLQRFLDEHQVLIESVNKLNQILINLDDQLKQQSNQLNSQLNKQLNDQQTEFTQLIETNVVQYIQNLFKTEVEMKLVQVKSVVDELKGELIEFIHNYKLPKHNEQEITNLINQILIKSVKRSSVIDKLNNSDQELRNDLEQAQIKAPKANESSSTKDDDDEKTSLEFDADDLFKDEKRMSDKEIEIKKMRKDKIKFNQLIWHGRPNDRLVSQYSDAVLNSINLNNRNGSGEDAFERIEHEDQRNDLKRSFNVLKHRSSDQFSNDLNRNQFNYFNSHLNHQLNHQLNQRHPSIFASRSKALNDGKSKDNFITLNTQLDSTNFHKKRQILEQDISNLKLQLGLLSTNRFRSSSIWNNL